ncbi:MAG TPA: hypothetical protein PK772_00125 [Chitinophagaceae bacterium]|nr:hypothetical protein [Chitinophagaceae bacterium]
MYNAQVVIINAYESNDFFASTLAREYDNQLTQQGISSALLFISNMYFSQTIFPEKYTFETLEPDLRKSVELIKSASTLTFFVSVGSKGTNPAFQSFINRLFHLTQGRINEGIWKRPAAYSKKVGIITILNDEQLWKQFKENRRSIYHPVNKVDFKLFGFGKVHTTTFGFLRETKINTYGLKCIEKIKRFAKNDSQ